MDDAGPGAEELARLRRVRAGRPPLPALTPAAYAAAHLPFEARSDQRARLVDWLAERAPGWLPDRGPRSVLSIGTGDGSVDGPLARSLVANGRPLRWLAVEPDPRVGEICVQRLRAAGVDDVALHPGRFDSLAIDDAAGRFDLVLAVHSFYYVADPAAALRSARDRVAPGGALVVLLAPQEGICRLTDLLAPRPDGIRQWWSADVRAAAAEGDMDVRPARIPARLDVGDCFDAGSAEGRLVLDFLVQAACDGLDPTGRRALLDALDALVGPDGAAAPGGGRTVPHPVDALVWQAPGGAPVTD